MDHLQHQRLSLFVSTIKAVYRRPTSETHKADAAYDTTGKVQRAKVFEPAIAPYPVCQWVVHQDLPRDDERDEGIPTEALRKGPWAQEETQWRQGETRGDKAGFKESQGDISGGTAPASHSLMSLPVMSSGVMAANII